MILIYYSITIALCFVVGFTGCKLLKLQDTELLKSTNFIYILIGLVFLVSMMETISLVLPVSISLYLICPLLLAGFIWCYHDLKTIVLSQLRKKDLFFSLILILIPGIVVGLPQLLENELFTVIEDNSDYIFYLSTMDWFQSHNILSEIVYSEHYPFYSFAEYMVNTTRIGYDLFGAFLVGLYNLEPHEVFSILSVLSAGFVAVSVYTCLLYFTGNKYIAVLVGVYTGSCANTIALIVGQYIVQLCGVALLLMSVTAIQHLLCKSSTKDAVLCGLFVSGTLAIYCEYAVYLCLAALLFLAICSFKRTVVAKHICIAIVSAILFNVLGFIKALWFNLKIFLSISAAGASAIDPYNGNIIGLDTLLYTILGGTSKLHLLDHALPKVLTVFLMLGVLAVLYFAFVKSGHFEKNAFCGVVVLLIVIFEAYFRISRGAYQEYKHLATMSCLFLVVAGIAAANLSGIFQFGKYKRILFLTAAIAVTMVSVYAPLKNYTQISTRIDSQTMELRDAVFAVCGNQGVEIGDTEWHPMRVVYALKDQPVFVGNSSYSYLEYYQKLNKEIDARYKLYARFGEMQIDLSKEEILWMNEQYVLTERISPTWYNSFSMTGSFYGWEYGEDVDVYPDTNLIVANAGNARYALYGPRKDLSPGVYDFVLECEVIQGDGQIGVFDIFSSAVGTLGQAEITGKETQYVLLENIPVSDETTALEYRVFVNEGVELKIEGILWKESAA